MRAILLCAGFATRLHPLTRDFPKPLLPVAGRPIVEDLVEQLAATRRVDRVTVVSNARFYRRFLAWVEALAPRPPGIDIEVLDDGATDVATRRGAVVDLALAVEQERLEDPVLVAAGDNLFRRGSPTSSSSPPTTTRSVTFLAWLVEREPVFTHEMRGVRLAIDDTESYRAAEIWLKQADRRRSSLRPRA